MGESRIYCQTVPRGLWVGGGAGIEEAVHLLKDLKVSVRAMKEGTIFRAFEPVMEIEGMYTEFGLF